MKSAAKQQRQMDKIRFKWMWTFRIPPTFKKEKEIEREEEEKTHEIW